MIHFQILCVHQQRCQLLKKIMHRMNNEKNYLYCVLLLILPIMIRYKTWKVAIECYLKCYMRHNKEKLFVKMGLER